MKNQFLIVLGALLVMASCKQEKPKEEAEEKTNAVSNTIETITPDGAWCWFSDPRAIYVHGENPGVLTGWVKADGTIEVAQIYPKGAIKTQILADTLDKDDHANPAFVELSNNQNMVFYTKHFDYYVRHHTSMIGGNELFNNAVLFDPFTDEELEKFPVKRTTYANPFSLEAEGGKLYCFGRWTGYKPNIMTSIDNGKSFSKSRVMITNYPFDNNNRPYVKYYSDGKSKIHIVFTDGHPSIELTNSIYYAYYENDAFWRADGTKICSMEELPFEPKDATVVYKADETNGKSWIYDVAADKKGNPVILYTRYPDDEHHIYHYTKYDGTTWIDNQIVDSGDWFPQTIEGTEERELNYSGGLTVNPLNTNIIFTSEEVNGIMEIVKYQLDDSGRIKSKEQITKDSKYDNIRPFIPRNMKIGDEPVVLWMQNEKYIHYTDYKTQIKYYKDSARSN
ncbi:MAG: BNR repeat-containing protein [Cyclobacteriaceae bacterium]|jgi:hypothetical protein|nr:BNR repeat-containing protein [Cyclobacteriaceae bacterium]